MKAPAPNALSLQHVRRIRATPEEVFAAFADPREIFFVPVRRWSDGTPPG